MRRPERQRARTALALVIVLAACRRGDPSLTTPGARVRGSPEHLFVRAGTLWVGGDEGDHVFELQQGGG